MIKRPNTNAQRLKRHKRVRGKIAKIGYLLQVTEVK